MFTTKKALQDQPVRLQPDQIKEAKQAISAFFESRTFGSIREELNQWYEAAISGNRPGYGRGSNRNELYCLYKQLELLILAVYIVDKNQEPAQ